MTHGYTILLGGTVLPGLDAPAVSAIAWAGDTVIGLGSDDDVRGLSRGDSQFVDLAGAYVVPLGPLTGTLWPPAATLEIGDRADLVILASDPRLDDPGGGRAPTVALIRGGHVAAGRLPGQTHVEGRRWEKDHHDQ